MSRALTEYGLYREWYSRNVEAAPSRFDGSGAYTRWAARADAAHDDDLALDEMSPSPTSIHKRQGTDHAKG